MTPTTVTLPRPVAFVLGGGASLGAVQVGMLQALAEAGIRPDLVVGTSVGALNGAILAAHPEDAADRLARTWSQMHRQDVFPGHLLGALWRLRRTGTHAVEAAGLHRLAASVLEAETFTELRIPLAVVTLDLTTGRRRVLDDGALLPALLASAAIPGVFPPVRLDGHLLVDGGVVANVPVAVASGLGARSLVVLDCTVPAPPGELGRVSDIVALVSQIQLRAQLEAALPQVAAVSPVVYLPAPPPRHVSPLDFDQTAPLVSSAREVAAGFLEDLVVDDPGLHGDPYSRYTGGSPNATRAAAVTPTPGKPLSVA